jgi:hypothetical protein
MAVCSNNGDSPFRPVPDVLLVCVLAAFGRVMHRALRPASAGRLVAG